MRPKLLLDEPDGDKILPEALRYPMVTAVIRLKQVWVLESGLASGRLCAEDLR